MVMIQTKLSCFQYSNPEYLEWAPRSYVERIYNIQRWTKMSKGGHFAALEQPDLLVKDIREFTKTLK